jgi:hypothetical protein
MFAWISKRKDHKLVKEVKRIDTFEVGITDKFGNTYQSLYEREAAYLLRYFIWCSKQTEARSSGQLQKIICIPGNMFSPAPAFKVYKEFFHCCGFFPYLLIEIVLSKKQKSHFLKMAHCHGSCPMNHKYYHVISGGFGGPNNIAQLCIDKS